MKCELFICRSIGCTVVEMLTCHPPLYDMEPMAALFRIATQPVSVNLPPHCSEHVQSFLKLCFTRLVHVIVGGCSRECFSIVQKHCVLVILM